MRRLGRNRGGGEQALQLNHRRLHDDRIFLTDDTQLFCIFETLVRLDPRYLVLELPETAADVHLHLRAMTDQWSSWLHSRGRVHIPFAGWRSTLPPTGW